MGAHEKLKQCGNIIIVIFVTITGKKVLCKTRCNRIKTMQSDWSRVSISINKNNTKWNNTPVWPAPSLFHCVYWLQSDSIKRRRIRNTVYFPQTNTFHLVDAAISIRCSINYAWRCGVCEHVPCNRSANKSKYIYILNFLFVSFRLLLADNSSILNRHTFACLQQWPHMHADCFSVFSTQNLLLWIWIGAFVHFDAAVALHWMWIRVCVLLYFIDDWKSCRLAHPQFVLVKLAYWLRRRRMLINYYNLFESTK